jgi:hypothetical protein
MRKYLRILGVIGLSMLPLQAGAWGGFRAGGVHVGAGGATAWHGAGWGGGGWGGAYHGGVTHVGAGGVTHVDYGGAYHAGYGGGAYYHPAHVAGGCWGCVSAGAVAAAGVVGLAAGAAIGSAAASASSPTTVVVQQPVIVTGPAIGTEVMALPGSGCNSASVNGIRYYNCGGDYYRPHFGNNGVYYTVVPAPF